MPRPGELFDGVLMYLMARTGLASGDLSGVGRRIFEGDLAMEHAGGDIAAVFQIFRSAKHMPVCGGFSGTMRICSKVRAAGGDAEGDVVDVRSAVGHEWRRSGRRRAVARA